MRFMHIDDSKISKRLRSQLTPWEFAALCWCVFLMLGFVFFNATTGMKYAEDFNIYMNAARGNPYFAYPYWSMPIFQFLEALPGEHLAFVLWAIVNIGGVWFAARVFGGNLVIALTCYSFGFTLFYGQTIGLIAAGVALAWWGLASGRVLLAGIGLAIVLIKPHTGIPIGLAIVLLAEVSWYDRIRVWLVPLIAAALSLIAYPNWVVIMLDELAVNPLITFGSIGFWGSFGLWALLIWLPPLLFPPRRDRALRSMRFIAFNAACALALPYFQQTGLVSLYVLPIGWLGLLGNVGYSFFWLFDDAFPLMLILPLVVYVVAIARMVAVTFPLWQRPLIALDASQSR